MQTVADQIDDVMPHMLRYAHYLCDTGEQAQVLVQSAMEKLLLRQKNHGPVDDLKSYTMTTLYNLRNDQLRWQQKQSQHLPLEDFVLVDTALNQPQRQTCQEVMDHIEALPKPHRDIFKYFIIDNLSYSEISDILNIPEGTVMSRLSRARSALRTSMDMTPASTVAELLDV